MTSVQTVSTRIHDAERISRRNITILIGVATLSILILVTNHSILFRSPWGDEVTLLRNLKIIGWSGAFFQLPLFDLASPAGATLSLRVLSELTQYHCPLMRLILLVLNFLFIYWATVATKIVHKEISFVLFWLCSPLIYYTTELKQYSFELIASYIMIITIAAARNRFELRLASVATLFLSFGAIIQVSAQTVMRGFDLLVEWHRDSGKTIRRRLVDLAITTAIVFAFVCYGRYLTQVQFSNFHDQSYENNGLILDALRLGKVIFLAHGGLLITTGLGILALSLHIFGWRAILYNNLTIFWLLCFIMVITLRLLELYPAVYPRHIIWIVPLSLFMAAIWLDKLLVHWRGRFVSAIPRLGLVLAAIVMPLFPMERSSNDGLFDALAKLPQSSNVVLNLGAQVALELYESKYPELSGNKYHGWVNPATATTIPEDIAMDDFAGNASTPGAFSSWTYFELNHNFRPLWTYLLDAPQASEFYVALSDQTPTGDPVLDDSAKAMVELMRERGCSFASTYSGYFAEILSVRCGK